MLRSCFLPGPCWGNKHGQCLDVLFTSVHPILWTRQTLEVGITAAIAVAAASMSPGPVIAAFDVQRVAAPADVSDMTVA